MKISTISKNKPKLVKLLTSLLVAAIWLSVWQLLYMLIGKGLLFASPAQAFKRLCALALTGVFWRSIGLSLLRITAGFLLGSAAAIPTAALTSRSRFAYALLSPALAVVKATPVASFIMLALVWIRSVNLSIFISFLMVLPMVWASLHQGIVSTDPALLEMAQVFGFSASKRLRLIYFPSVKPYLVSALTAAIGFAWKAGVAAEVLAYPRDSIGFAIYSAKAQLETADLFAWTFVVVVLSIVIEKLFVGLVRGAAHDKI